MNNRKLADNRNSTDAFFLIHKHQGLVRAIACRLFASRYHRMHQDAAFDRDDAISEAYRISLDAARRYKPERGVPFANYLCQTLRLELRRFGRPSPHVLLNDLTWRREEEEAQPYDAPDPQAQRDVEALSNPLLAFSRYPEYRCELFTKARITAKQRKVLELLIAGNSQTEIAQMLSISNALVAYHRARATRKLEPLLWP